MNLANPKKLSISGLEGLAALLELLANYFKVEIGHKLLDHFRAVADPQQLNTASRVSISETERIPKLVKLAHIFRLLHQPPASSLKVMSIQLSKQRRSCTTREPLAKYLHRILTEGMKYLLQNLKL